jgi:YD repeat-containing protein
MELISVVRRVVRVKEKTLALRSALIRTSSVAVAALMVTAASVQGQSPLLNSVNNQTQVPIPGAGHDYQHLLGETVNFSNGSVSFKLAFPVAKGRGITIPYAWSYNSASVNPLDSVDGNTPAWDVLVSHLWPQHDGWNIDEGIPMASEQVWSVTGNGIDQYTGQVDTADTWIPCNFQSGMTFTDMGGVTHNLRTGAQAPAYFNSSDGGYIYTCPGGSVSFTTPPNGDGQVIATLDPYTTILPHNAPTNSYLYQNSPESGDFTVMDKDGTVYSFSGGMASNWAPNITFAASGITDRNGNTAGYDPSSGNWLDTLGRVWPSRNTAPSTTGSSSVVATVDGLSYTGNWITESISYIPSAKLGQTPTGVACEPMPAGVSGTRVQLHTLALPNGQSYQFFYGNNNPTDSTVLNSFGLLNEIIFPDGGWIKYKWQLPPPDQSGNTQYNEMTSMGGLSQVSLPGGTIREQPVSFGCVWQFQEPVLAKRTVSFDGTHLAQTQTFQFGTTWSGTNGSINGWSQKTAKVVTTDNVRNLTSETDYTYTPMTSGGQPFSTSNVASQIPVESTITYYDWGQTTKLETVSKQWKDQFNLANEITTVYTASGGSRVSGTVYTYESNVCNDSQHQMMFDPTSTPPVETDPTQSLIYLAEQDDYDYGPGRLGPLSRKTSYNYGCFNSPFASAVPEPAIPPEISSVTVEDGNGKILSATQYGFDAGTLTGVTAIQQASSYSGVTVRGNLTSAVRCSTLPANPTASCSGPTTTYTYDSSGQPRTMRDPRSHTTTFSFADQYTDGSPSGTNAYLTKIIYTDGLTRNFKYSFNYGYLTWSQDENGQVTTYEYNTNAGCPGTPDGMFRLGEVDSPDGGVTTYCYNDSQHTTTKNVLVANVGGTPVSLTAASIYDGMGQTTQSQLVSDPDGETKTDTQYDGEGKVYTLSNPYRGTTPPANLPLTTHYYDAVGRGVATKEQDNTVVHSCFNGLSSRADPGGTHCHHQIGSVASSSQPGTWVDSSDERGGQWQRTSDAFGNLLEVMEPNGTSTSPYMETDYGYDSLNRLVSVVQNGGSAGSAAARNRQFAYDNLSRLVNAYNPETGTITYSYDLDGNVLTKTDARKVVVNYAYDTRNRLLSKSYSADPTGTPASCYQYGVSSDKTWNGAGRLKNAWTQTSQACPTSPSSYLTLRAVQSYDLMGRLLQEQQYTLANQATGQTYTPTYTYDSAGNLLTAQDGITTIPGGNLLTLSWNTASSSGTAGRVQTITSNWNDTTHPQSLFGPAGTGGCAGAQAGQYGPAGGLMNATFGNLLSFNRTYDARLRVDCEIDQATGAATPGSATITITGAEQSK